MALVYMGLARKDLVDIAKYVVAIGHPEPVAYLSDIQSRLLSMYINRNPGVVGRVPGTVEWMLLPTPYIAVVKWMDGDARIYRVLPARKIKKPRQF
ncbi:MAG: hypothetical protein ABWZ54_02475 [Luteibacter sp.]